MAQDLNMRIRARLDGIRESVKHQRLLPVPSLPQVFPKCDPVLSGLRLENAKKSCSGLWDALQIILVASVAVLLVREILTSRNLKTHSHDHERSSVHHRRRRRYDDDDDGDGEQTRDDDDGDDRETSEDSRPMLSNEERASLGPPLKVPNPQAGSPPQLTSTSFRFETFA